MITNIKRLVRKDATGKWWYTLRWLDESKGKDNSFMSSQHCFDSKQFDNYRECLKEVRIHKKLLENKEER